MPSPSQPVPSISSVSGFSSGSKSSSGFSHTASASTSTSTSTGSFPVIGADTTAPVQTISNVPAASSSFPVIGADTTAPVQTISNPPIIGGADTTAPIQTISNVADDSADTSIQFPDLGSSVGESVSVPEGSVFSTTVEEDSEDAAAVVDLGATGRCQGSRPRRPEAGF